MNASSQNTLEILASRGDASIDRKTPSINPSSGGGDSATFHHSSKSGKTSHSCRSVSCARCCIVICLTPGFSGGPSAQSEDWPLKPVIGHQGAPKKCRP